MFVRDVHVEVFSVIWLLISFDFIHCICFGQEKEYDKEASKLNIKKGLLQLPTKKLALQNVQREQFVDQFLEQHQTPL